MIDEKYFINISLEHVQELLSCAKVIEKESRIDKIFKKRKEKMREKAKEKWMAVSGCEYPALPTLIDMNMEIDYETLSRLLELKVMQKRRREREGEKKPVYDIEAEIRKAQHKMALEELPDLKLDFKESSGRS